jgi:glutamate---cysteine ligase / carboxylate-amine ligase
VEEELLLVHPDSGEALAVASSVLAHVRTGSGRPGDETLTGELTQEQLETAVRPCLSLDELEVELRRSRRAAAAAAEVAGAAAVALASSPLPVQPSITPSPRYQQMMDRFGLTAQEQLVCGCHVHVEIDSDDEGVAVADRIRGWLSPLLALSANSPFWQGVDSGYASFRSQVWGRWPSTGPTELFGSAENYHATVLAMVDSRTILDENMVYFDARLSPHQPTLEVRIADVCLRREDAVLLAALVRALVDTAARAWRAGAPPAALRVELLRLAAWRAGRSGLDGELLNGTGRPSPAGEVLRTLIQQVAPALEESGELDVVQDLASALLHRGNGANAQRKIHRATARLSDVVGYALKQTVDS